MRAISEMLPVNIISEKMKLLSEKVSATLRLNKGVHSYIYYYKNKLWRPTRDQIYKICNRLSEPKEVLDNLKMIANRDYFLDEIIEIKDEFYEGSVYDLSVPNNNNYMADGIFVHNCFVDEYDKQSKDVKNSLLESMESRKVSIDKYGVHIPKPAAVNIIAMMNPKGGLTADVPLIVQLNLPDHIRSRFHLIIPFFEVSSDKYGQIAVMMKLKNDSEKRTRELNEYVSMVKMQYPLIEIPDKIRLELGDKIRDLKESGQNSALITPRLLTGASTMLMARARMQMRQIANDKDLRYVMHILEQIYNGD